MTPPRSTADADGMTLAARSLRSTLQRTASSSFFRVLTVIAAAALAWRLIYVRLELPYAALTDEAWYMGMAKELFGPHAWTSIFTGLPTAQHGPLTSILVSPVAWLFPHALAGLRNVMVLVGVANVVMMGLAGREVGGEKVGLWAAGLAAVYPDFWVRDGLVVSEPVAALLVTCSVYVYLRCRRGVTWPKILTLGLLAGLVLLARPEIAPVLFVLAAFAIWRSPQRTSWVADLARFAAALGVAAAVIVPWALYNEGRFADSVLLSNNIGITLAGANCGDTYYSSALIGYDSPACWNAAQNTATKVSSDESVQSAVMKNLGLTYAEHHWHRLPLVVSMRVAWFLGLYRPGWVVHMGTLGGQPAWATWAQGISFYIVALAAAALWWRQRRANWPHGLFLALILNSFLVAATFVGHWRYRVTMDVALVLIVALGIDQWSTRRGGRADSSPSDGQLSAVADATVSGA